MTEKKAKEQNRMILLSVLSVLVAGPGLVLSVCIGGIGQPRGLFACVLLVYPLWAVVSGVLAGWLIPQKAWFPLVPALACLCALWVVGHSMEPMFLACAGIYYGLCLGARGLTRLLLRRRKKSQK